MKQKNYEDIVGDFHFLSYFTTGSLALGGGDAGKLVNAVEVSTSR